MKGKREETGLTQAQLEILGVLWERDEAGISEIARTIQGRRRVSRPTILIQILRLKREGWVLRRKEGRTFYYRAAKPRQKVLGRLAARLVEVACGGCSEYLVRALFQERGLSREEVRRLREMIEKEEERPADGKDRGGKHG